MAPFPSETFLHCSAILALGLSCEGLLGQIGAARTSPQGSPGDSPSGPGPTVGGVPGTPGSAQCDPGAQPVGTAPTRRLTRDEYIASVKTLGVDGE
jgi:hypothetical protein